MQTRALTHPRALLVAAATALATAVGATPSQAADAATAPACGSAVATGVLPAWARGGFSEARPRSLHVTGRSGEIMAILFGSPLRSPPAHDRNNKILWVARTPPAGSSTLYVRGQRMNGAANVGSPVSRRVMGGPGPSIIDVPEAGCWRFTLTWYGHSDTLDLRYR
jgi:hypothetical protein